MSEEAPKKYTREYFQELGRKGGKLSTRKLTKKEARRMVKCREKNRRPKMRPACLQCIHLDKEEIICSIKRCVKEIADGKKVSRRIN